MKRDLIIKLIKSISYNYATNTDNYCIKFLDYMSY
ncbi:hypothetical protein bsdtw1_01369 [Clostridium fungisolvens]|uniref:Uncharacterized protein n=1 Tax=Clostridium fungisolvens TaxID=1604897 RepID=A0A6V8SFN8_9CLOT|nr:hypothetical protein bsdtw1_01369 [Clostridium fungisolvens]